MIINEVCADGYKNLSDINITLDEKMNVFCGDNAQGKTNLIEAVWLCSGCRSFRGSREKEFIGFSKDIADVRMKFTNSYRTQEIRFAAEKSNVKEKSITLNGVKLPFMSKLFGNFQCVVFTPDDLDLSKGPPDNRRSFIDLFISQVKPSYLGALTMYIKVLGQRNAFLKNLSKNGGGDLRALEVWDVQLAKAGAYISVLRHQYCINLDNYAGKLYGLITSGKENLSLYYKSTIYENDAMNGYTSESAGIYLDMLRQSLDDDIKAGFTTRGVHRDDIIAEIDGQPLRYLGSQGQSRSAAIVMKLAQAEIINIESGEYPVMLLDDVMSELDEGRRRFILTSIENMQVLITCCDENVISEMKRGKIFTIEKGKITEERHIIQS